MRAFLLIKSRSGTINRRQITSIYLNGLNEYVWALGDFPGRYELNCRQDCLPSICQTVFKSWSAVQFCLLKVQCLPRLNIIEVLYLNGIKRCEELDFRERGKFVSWVHDYHKALSVTNIIDALSISRLFNEIRFSHNTNFWIRQNKSSRNLEKRWKNNRITQNSCHEKILIGNDMRN